MTATSEVLVEIANLHDAFMNANLMRMVMEREKLVMGPEEFLISNRGRLERAWAAYLYILVEAWRAKSNANARQYMETKMSLDRLDEVLRNAEKSGLIKTLRGVRHYMCHRDKRKYWDPGRYGLSGT